MILFQILEFVSLHPIYGLCDLYHITNATTLVLMLSTKIFNFWQIIFFLLQIISFKESINTIQQLLPHSRPTIMNYHSLCFWSTQQISETANVATGRNMNQLYQIISSNQITNRKYCYYCLEIIWNVSFLWLLDVWHQHRKFL